MQCRPLGAPIPLPPSPLPRPGDPPEPRDEFRPGGSPPHPDLLAARPAPPGPREQRALQAEKEQQDRLQARHVYARMRADRELFQARIAALLVDLQTEVQRIWEEVMLRRRKVHDEIMEAWAKVLFG